MSMRFSQQPWNKIVTRAAVVVAGVGQTALNIFVAVERIADGLWLQSGGGSWGGSYDFNAMTGIDAVNQPGMYEYEIPAARLDYALGLEGYRCKYFEAGLPFLEYEWIETKPAFSGEAAAGLATAGTSTSVTLGASWAPSVANFFVSNHATIVGGTGAGQTRLITAYTSGRVATVHPAWTTTPDTTSTIVVHAAANTGWSAWEELRSGHTSTGSFGEGAKIHSLTPVAAGATAWNEIGHTVWRRNATTGVFGTSPTGSEADWLSGGTLQNQWWATIFAAITGATVRGGVGTLIQACDNAHAGGTRFYIAGSGPGSGSSEWVGTYAVYVPAGSPTIRPIEGVGAGGRVTTLVRVTAAGTDGTGNYLDVIGAINGAALGAGGIAVGDWLIGIHTQSIATAKDVWERDIEAALGGSGGLMLPPSTSALQRTAAGLLQAVNEASLQGFRNATATEWGNVFLSSTSGTTTKFYYAAPTGPAVVASASWAGKSAVWIVASTGARRLVKVVSVSTDGSVHFVLSLPDGTALPTAVAANDRLLVLQGSTSLTTTDLFTASMSAYETAGTFGNAINRILRLRQENLRVVNTAWASNNQPTAGYVLIYASSADLTTDTGPGWALAKGRYDFTATYNGSLQLTEYESVRTL